MLFGMLLGFLYTSHSWEVNKKTAVEKQDQEYFLITAAASGYIIRRLDLGL